MTELAQRLIVDATDPLLTEAQLRSLAIAAKDVELYGLAVRAGRAKQAAIMLARSLVRVRAMIGYPGGVHTASVKGLETRLALQDGAMELALVPDLGFFLGGESAALAREVAYVAKAVREVAPARSSELHIVYDMTGLRPDQLAALGETVLTSGGQGVHLLSEQLLEPDTLRALRSGLGARAASLPVTLQMVVADADAAQALLDAGADFIVTPNAAELA